MHWRAFGGAGCRGWLRRAHGLPPRQAPRGDRSHPSLSWQLSKSGVTEGGLSRSSLTRRSVLPWRRCPRARRGRARTPRIRPGGRYRHASRGCQEPRGRHARARGWLVAGALAGRGGRARGVGLRRAGCVDGQGRDRGRRDGGAGSDRPAGIAERGMSASVELGAAASRPGLRASPGRAPACGARTRPGGSCLGLAMASGRCRIHGGASTGPRTAVGLARIVAAKTTHGRFAMSGAPQRLAQRFVRTFLVRARLTAEATMVREYLPDGMAARLDSAPAELMPPKHPSQVAFEALHATAPGNRVPQVFGLGRRAQVARARLGVSGRVVDGAAVALRGRAAERRAMAVETAAQATWRAAIVAARELKCSVQEARGQMGEVRNDPIRGTVRGQTRASSNEPIRGSAVGGRTRTRRNDPIRGMDGHQTSESCNDPIRGSDGQTGDTRNDPIRGLAAMVRGAGAPLDTRVGVLAERRAGETALWGPGSPGLGEALARELEKRRLRAEVGLRGNDPIRGNAAGAGAGDGARAARAVTGLGLMRGAALGSTTLARTWEPDVAEVLATRFGSAVVVGWLGTAAAPPGIAAMPRRHGAQRPYTRLGRLGTDGAWRPVGR